MIRKLFSEIMQRWRVSAVGSLKKIQYLEVEEPSFRRGHGYLDLSPTPSRNNWIDSVYKGQAFLPGSPVPNYRDSLKARVSSRLNNGPASIENFTIPSW